MIRCRPLRQLLAACIAALPLVGAAQSLTFVTEEAFPFQYLEQQRLTGMAVEVVNEMVKRAQVNRKDELLSWKDAYDRAQLQSNTCIYSTARTESRERLFKWVGPIVENKWAAFAKKGFAGSLTKPEDFRQYRVGVLQGDAKERYLRDLAAPYRFPVADDAANPPKLTLDRKAPDKIDLWITGYYGGKHVAAKTGVTDLAPVWVFQTSPNYLACNPGVATGVVEKLQAALDGMKRDGTHAAIVARYDAVAK